MLTARSELWHGDSTSVDPVASSPGLTELNDAGSACSDVEMGVGAEELLVRNR